MADWRCASPCSVFFSRRSQGLQILRGTDLQAIRALISEASDPNRVDIRVAIKDFVWARSELSYLFRGKDDPSGGSLQSSKLSQQSISLLPLRKFQVRRPATTEALTPLIVHVASAFLSDPTGSCDLLRLLHERRSFHHEGLSIRELFSVAAWEDWLMTGGREPR